MINYKEDISSIPTPKNSTKVLDFLFSTPIFSAKLFIERVKIEKRKEMFIELLIFWLIKRLFFLMIKKGVKHIILINY